MSSKIPPTTATDYFDHYRNRIFSRKGGWLPGHGVFSHGYEVMRDFVGKLSYMQVIILNASGRLPTRELADWFEAAYICLSWPDPRIWCNHVGALGGSMRTSCTAATCAGILASHSYAYGGKPLLFGMEFIRRALQTGMAADEIVDDEISRHGGKPIIMGYARPLAKGDERISALENVSASLGFETGPHLQLAYAIERVLQERFDEYMNINGYASAFLSDQGFSPTEAYRACSILVNSGVTACYADARDRKPDTFLPMRCEDVEYTGPAPRKID